MLRMEVRDLRSQVRVALRDRCKSPWMPGLAEPLSRVVLKQLESEIGITHASYGTVRVLRRNPKEQRLVAAKCNGSSNTRTHTSGKEIALEILPLDIARRIVGQDVQFLDEYSVVKTVAQQIQEALSLLDLVSTALPTVCALVRSIHIINPIEDDTDVSFSDPALPFSIFVSVPLKWTEIAALRVAEAILHEAMHLQLTLVERVVPLVRPQRKMYYSPWRDEVRNSEGILQALYAFVVIRSFLREVPLRWSSPVNDYVTGRIAQISCQIEEAQDFRECDELTPDGTAFVARLLDSTN